MKDNYMLESMLKYVGQTVTIFTASGGLSGSGFTGVLAGANQTQCILFRGALIEI